MTEVGVGLRCAPMCPDEAAIRERVRSINPQAILFSVQPLQAAYAEQFARPRAASALVEGQGVRGSNTAAQAFYRRLGFEDCGRLVGQVMIDGVEDDEMLMELLRAE